MSKRTFAVDVIGVLRAVRSGLKSVQDRFEKQLKDAGEGEYEGRLFRAVVFGGERESLIADKVRELLHPNQLRVCVRTTPYTSVKVTGRKVA